MSSPEPDRMSSAEIRAASSLAGIFGLRMLGMFLILPVFAIYARQLDGASNEMLIGLALGIYGLTQALLQLPFGIWSDRIGRKPVIYIGLVLFALGSLVAALAHDIYWIIFGRALQGSGAISAAVTAMLADLTREEHRTKAMAMVGSTIGLSFAVSMIAGPWLYQHIGVPGMFAMTGALALAAIAVVAFWVPEPPPPVAAPARFAEVLHNPELLRLNFGILVLHATQMAMFVVIPVALLETGFETARHWQVYLPVMLVSFAVMVPALIAGERRGKAREVFLAAIALMLVATVAMTFSLHRFTHLVALLGLYFIAFNILEACLPSLISKMAPANGKGAAMGIYNTCQALGIFIGGAAGGAIAHRFDGGTVFYLSAVLLALWWAVAWSMTAPPQVQTLRLPLGQACGSSVQELARHLSGVRGVREVVVEQETRTARLKVAKGNWDEQRALELLSGAPCSTSPGTPN